MTFWKMNKLSVLLAFLLCLWCAVAVENEDEAESVDIKETVYTGVDITKTTLYFYKDKNTVSRKHKYIESVDADSQIRPKKQMVCVGGSANCSYMPSVIACYNRGFDGYDYHWECKAELPANVTLGEVSISCESFNKENDGIVLQGSCNIEYYLNQRRLLRISSNHQSFLQKLVRGHGLIVLVILSGLFVLGIRRLFLLLWFIVLLPYNLIMSLYVHFFYPTFSYPFFSDKPNSNPFVLEYYSQGKSVSNFYIVLSWGLVGLLFTKLYTSETVKEKVESKL